MNSLTAFKLISICEGHAGKRRPADRPHMNLRLREEHMAVTVQHWSSVHDQLEEAALECFKCDATLWEFELTLGTRRSRLRPQRQKDFVVRLSSEVHRTTAAPEASVTRWFSEIVPAVEAFDQRFIEAVRRGF
jgi:hypothetical protein